MYHFKSKLGKFKNIVNTNHRHDEEHEKATDDKRTRIAEGHRFQSFAPERDGNKIKWYVDGRDYFWAVSVALEKAKETIYIEDWWLSPELFLRRPPYYNQEWRLDQVLKRRAEAGVKIYVIVYKEVAAAVSCNSAHTKHALHELCPKGTPGYGNIVCMRHPDHNVFENAGDMTFYWAHHEKFIVIDYALAFIGGLDLCFGRWDDRQHPLADVHPAGVKNEVFPGQDFNNNRIMDFQSVDDWKSNELSKADYGRMPWHDVAMGVIGDCVYDIAEHFVLRWNFVKRDKYKRNDGYPWLTLQGREGENEDLVAVQRPKFPVGGYEHHPLSPLENKPWAHEHQGTVHAQIVRSSCDWSSGILTEHSIQNAYCEVIRNAQHFVYIENQFFITATGENQAPIHNTIGAAIVDACVKAGKEGRKFRVIIVIPAIPGFAGDLRDDAAMGTRAIMDYQYKSIHRGEHSIFERIRAQGVDPANHIFIFNLRAYDRLNKTAAIEAQEEKSGVKYQEVQRANAEEIMGGGIPSSTDENPKHKDDSGNQEMERNMDKKRQFEAARTEAGLGGKESTEADSIAASSMLNGGKVSDRHWDGDAESEKANFVQEELYIHGKLCIADDRIAICGSSNINDRVSSKPPSPPGLDRTNINPSLKWASTTANSPLSWKTKTSWTPPWMDNPTKPATMPPLSAASSGANISASSPPKPSTPPTTPMPNPLTSAPTTSTNPLNTNSLPTRSATKSGTCGRPTRRATQTCSGTCSAPTRMITSRRLMTMSRFCRSIVSTNRGTCMIHSCQ